MTSENIPDDTKFFDQALTEFRECNPWADFLAFCDLQSTTQRAILTRAQAIKNEANRSL